MWNPNDPGPNDPGPNDPGLSPGLSLGLKSQAVKPRPFGADDRSEGAQHHSPGLQTRAAGANRCRINGRIDKTGRAGRIDVAVHLTALRAWRGKAAHRDRASCMRGRERADTVQRAAIRLRRGYVGQAGGRPYHESNGIDRTVHLTALELFQFIVIVFLSVHGGCVLRR